MENKEMVFEVEINGELCRQIKKSIYFITPFGKVYSYLSGNEKKAHDNGKGYMRISLRADKYIRCHYVHRLVAEYFIGESPLDVNHIDGNKFNNHFSNLEYVNDKQNLNHAYVTGLKKGKLNKEQVNEIKALYNNGVRQRDLVKQFNVSPAAICTLLKGRSYKFFTE
jgi:hypothetical protein